MSVTDSHRQPPGEPIPPAGAGHFVACETFIEGQLKKTRGQVKGVEIAIAVMKLLAGLLAYLLVFVVIDQWVLPGGLGFWGRLAAFLGFVGGGGFYFVGRVLPLFVRRVNPVYAAHAIEQAQPSLKNSLVNFLLLRRERKALPAAVYETIEERAARDLSHVSIEGSVDRSPMIRVGYVLLALVSVACLYKLLSPKDPLQSFSRMAAPWADLAPATRVTIGDVQPGSTQVFRGENIQVSAMALGVEEDEPVTLFYTTADGESVDRPIAMQLPENGYRHEAELPGGTGLNQNVDYYLAAGDAKTPRFQIHVVAAPAILVESVEYAYPAYAEVPNRMVERQGDLQGIQGTRVTIRAKANVPMASAYIDFDSNGGRDLPLAIDNQRASGTFELALKDDGTPLYKSYQLRFTDGAGRENPQPIRSSIEVLPDQPPEIDFVLPGQDEVEVPVNGALAMTVRAADRDFKLRRVSVFFEHQGRPLRTEELLDEPRAGRFESALMFDPTKLESSKVRAGDEVVYWAEARDNHAPVANHTQTPKYRIRLVDPLDEQERQRQLAQAKKKLDEAREREPDDRLADARGARDDDPDKAGQKTPEQTPAEEKADQRRSEQEPADVAAQEGARPEESHGESAKRQGERPDPEKNPAQAMQEILDHEQAQRPEQPREDEQQKSSGEPGNEESQQDKGKGQGKQDQGQGKGDKNSTEKSGGQQGAKAADQQKKNRQDQQQPQEQQGQQGQGKSGQGDRQPGDQQQDDRGASGQQSETGQNKNSQGAQGQEGAGEGAEPANPQSSGGAGKEKKQPGSASQNGSEEGTGAGDSHSSDVPKAGGKQGHEKQESDQSQGDAGGDQRGEKQNSQTGQGQGASQPQNQDSTGRPGSGSGAGDRAAEKGGMKKRNSPSEKNGHGQQQSGGDPDSTKGNSGSGQSTKNPKPTPTLDQQNELRDKQQQSPGGEDASKDEASDVNAKTKESSAEGGESGDRSAGGKQGAGQKANKPGTGGEGQNTPADEGSGQAEGAGQGDAAQQAGDKVAGEQPKNGEGKKTAGQGAQGKSGQPPRPEESQSGDAPSGEPDAKQPGIAETKSGKKSNRQPQGGEHSGDPAAQRSPAEGNSSDHGSSEPDPNDNTPAGPPSGRAVSSDAREGKGGAETGGGPRESDLPPDDHATEPDAPNLEYAKKATDLVLDSLKDQLAKNRIDEELLEKLNWSREDLEKFIQRWDAMRAAAAKSGAAGERARRELDEALEGLQLQRRGVTLRGRQRKPDDVRRLRDARTSNPPPEYAEQFKAYTEGTSKTSAAQKK